MIPLRKDDIITLSQPSREVRAQDCSRIARSARSASDKALRAHGVRCIVDLFP